MPPTARGGIRTGALPVMPGPPVFSAEPAASPLAPLPGTRIKRFARCESGATAVEYTLIATLVSAAVIVGAIALGAELGAMFGSFAPKIHGPS